MNQPVNPYVIDALSQEKRGFFDRENTLDWVVQELRNPATNTIVLLGQRAIGKTFLLRQLERTLPDDLFLPVYFDLQGQAARPLGQVLAGLAGAFAQRAGLQSPGSNLFDDQGQFFSRTFLPRFCTVALRKSRCPVFLLDEFDVLDEAAKAKLPETAAIKTLLPFLQDVGAGDSRTAFVFAAGRMAEDFEPDLTTTSDSFSVREVIGLDWASADELVRQAETNGTLQFSALAVSHALSFTNGHPHLTQLLCQRMWERAYADNPTEPPLIDALVVEDAVADVLDVGGQTFAWLWDGLSPAEKIYTAALAELADAGETVHENNVLQAIADQAAWLCTPETESAPDSLVRRWILEEIEGREHGFAVELFRLWVRQNKPLLLVGDEVGWTAPLAEQLFAEGQGFVAEWQWESAIRCFRDALEADPHHFHARMRLGEALLELGQIDDAVDELEQAHELNPAKARSSLERALAAQTRTHKSMLDSSVPTSLFLSTDQPAHDLQTGAPIEPDDVSFLSDVLPEEQDEGETEVAPTGAARAILFNVSRWTKWVRRALRGGRLVEALRLGLPVVMAPVLSALIFYGIGVSLARVMDRVTWIPSLFNASTSYRFGLISAILGMLPGLQFSYEFIKQPAFSLELVYLSLWRIAYPFLAVILIYGILALLSWALQVSVPENEWAGFQVFFGWLQKLFEKR
ncbi:MAG: tetratricopeptide repeat protein [Chloroflexi bacterium]|nr:tetratricopeptide repeat protein [Chloroflexota bacterium]